MTKPITQPTQYKTCVIAPTPNAAGFDVFDSSGRWFHVTTQKQAKWWGSIHTRLETEFMSHAPKPVPTPTENHTPKAKSI